MIVKYVNNCDASKWRLGTTAVVPGLPPLARDAVVPARHSLGVLSSTRAQRFFWTLDAGGKNVTRGWE